MIIFLVIVWIFYLLIVLLFQKQKKELVKFQDRTDEFYFWMSMRKHSYEYYETGNEIAEVLIAFFGVLLFYLSYQIIFGSWR